MLEYILYALVGFFVGGVMFSYLIPKIFCKVDTVKEGSDHNPGAANAISVAGKGVGIICLLLDVAKGFLPVFLAKTFIGNGAEDPLLNPLFSLVIIAPTAGHAFSPMMKFKGGKAIAVTCGALLALAPQSLDVVWLVLIMTLLSLVVIVKPDSLRMIISMSLLFVFNIVLNDILSVRIGVCVIAAIVIFKHVINYGEEKANVRLFFMKKK
ncbi:MAG: glycerol-3-phosphate acyltransferase [Clostridiales bacterium]|nr:glycerol-3-phosphate acyltransferase [Clostridiales bacterium]